MLKKILAVALAAAVILGLASVAFARRSATVDHNARPPLSSSPVWACYGYEDGTFRPDNPITRAELRGNGVLTGLKDAAEMLAGVPFLSRTSGESLGAGYISIAQAGRS